MYVKRLKLTNIKSFSTLELNLNAQPGWHVIIGDNGSGKSTILRAIAIGLIGTDEIGALRKNWYSWIQRNVENAEIRLDLAINDDYDKVIESEWSGYIKGSFRSVFTIIKSGNQQGKIRDKTNELFSNLYPYQHNIEKGKGWFSASYGAYRRFTGGSREWDNFLENKGKVAPHLTLFFEDAALKGSLDWLSKLKFDELGGDSDAGKFLKHFTDFINSGELLPFGAKIEKITYDEFLFKDGKDNLVSIFELSDGYRSVLSMTFDLIRQLINTYDMETVSNSIGKENTINLPGVVMIDEVDNHLHPTWQAKIGDWFTKYFPKIQFIVATHSPIICRAASTGQIWRLTAPDSDEPTYEIKGIEKDKLLYGNILDALDTKVFGENIERSKEGKAKLERLAILNSRHAYGIITDEEKIERNHLRKIFTTDAPSFF